MKQVEVAEKFGIARPSVTMLVRKGRVVEKEMGASLGGL
jgi:predicted XRE-type DNA-binding protein